MDFQTLQPTQVAVFSFSAPPRISHAFPQKSVPYLRKLFFLQQTKMSTPGNLTTYYAF